MTTPIKNLKMTGAAGAEIACNITLKSGFTFSIEDGANYNSVNSDGAFIIGLSTSSEESTEGLLFFQNTDSDFQGYFIKGLTDTGAVRFAITDNTVYSRFGFTMGANSHQLAPVKLAVKTSATTRVNNTLADDPHLVISVGANETWQFEAWLPGEVIDSGGWLGGLLFPTSPTNVSWSFSFEEQDTNTYLSTGYAGGPDLGMAVNTAGGIRFIIHIWGTLINGANAGDIKLKWAQNSTDSDGTQLYAGGYLKATQQIT